MGTQSAMFGPLKYAILPQHLAQDDLVRANGWVGLGTFLAILFGSVGGGLLVGMDENLRYLMIGGAVVVVVALGLLASLFIPPAPATQPDQPWIINPLRQTWRVMRDAPRPVISVIFAIGWFWLIGSGYLTKVSQFYPRGAGW